MESLELVQSGLKMADLTLAEVIAISHSRIRPLLKNNKARIKGNKYEQSILDCNQATARLPGL